MRSILRDVVLTVQLCVIAVNATFYMASFFGYGQNQFADFFLPSLICLFFVNIPSLIRDRRFFLAHYGFGLLSLRSQFPLEFFPARREDWLNPLGWCAFAIVLLHFAAAVLKSSEGSAPQHFLRFQAILIIVGGTVSALGWMFPPTKEPGEDTATT